MTEVGTIEIVVPDDASSLIEQCSAGSETGNQCPAQAKWRVMTACSACPIATVWPFCDKHKNVAVGWTQRWVVTACCQASIRVIVEAL